MILELDTASAVPIYVQLRNQIVMGIGRGELKNGENLPTVRQLAHDAGINAMTVNKAYGILREEGFIEIDRRHGARVAARADRKGIYRERLEEELELLAAESKARGIEKEDFLSMCGQVFDQLFLTREVAER